MTYTTQSGDTWDLIAYKLYENERQMSTLLRANPEHADMVIFSAGTILLVPDIEIVATSTLPPWKEAL